MTDLKRARAEPGPKQNALVIRGSRLWRDWLKRFAEHLRTDQAGAIDRALEETAKREKFERPPPRK